MKRLGMLIVLLWDANQGFLSHLTCYSIIPSGQQVSSNLDFGVKVEVKE